MNLADLILYAAYASLVIEMTCFPIPSEASVWQLLAEQRHESTGDALARARSHSRLRKVLTFFLPTAFGVLLFVLPLLVRLGFPGTEFANVAIPPALTAIGIGLILLGRSITFTSVLQLRAQKRRGGGPPGGLFAWSRNPGLVGMYTMYLGLCCLHPHWLMWIGFPIYVANMTSRVLLEEANLLARHGDSWQRYAAVVPRYLGKRAPSKAHIPHG
jgi:protein-S-isoprenylcysteine O-methyltransferase Ste14